jgi:hypothetical protein
MLIRETRMTKWEPGERGATAILGVLIVEIFAIVGVALSNFI